MAISLRENLCVAERLPRSDSVLMGRAELLKRPDRDLLEAVLVRGQSVAALARIMGADPRSLRVRVRRLGRRLTSRRFLDAARALPYLGKEEAELARLRFCQGATLRELCDHFNVSWHCLRRRLDQVSAQVATVRRMTGLDRRAEGT
ncbi:MAG: hypothetical protein WC869_14850 [Phycisphaerae bacterium]|jgi:transposase-like protein